MDWLSNYRRNRRFFTFKMKKGCKKPNSVIHFATGISFEKETLPL